MISGRTKVVTAAAILIIADQITKFFTPRDFLIRNYGLPFGINLQSWNWLVLVIVALILMAYFTKAKSKLSYLNRFGFLLIFAGAVSNIIDRSLFGFVRDLISLGLITINLADLYIVAGIVLASMRPFGGITEKKYKKIKL